jgi:predicted nucleic acid-binding protein
VIVVDVNVIVYLLTETPQREQARRVRERDGDWLVPPLWRHEMLNVLTTLTRQEVLDKSSALTVWRNAIGLLGSREQQPDMETHEPRFAATRGVAAAVGTGAAREQPRIQRISALRGKYKNSAQEGRGSGSTRATATMA